MASHRLRRNDYSATKQRALDDAKSMQAFVIESCRKLSKEIPQYQLSELIGKGSYGRVYKAKSLASGKLVAIKTIDIEQGDSSNPRMADTYSDLMKEINALKLLRESNAKNINHVIEALAVGQSIWVITEYCAGGSVATLMRPNASGGLHEKWVIPILREVAEALTWVHAQGIIHRDLKGANVLIAEEGAVQLCDFGVAGVIATKFDKRTTVIGTPHWMAPELFDEFASYGTEIDIWAFGAMAYEIAFGQPPNVAFGMDLAGLGTHLKHHSPRLDGNQYSAGLKDIVAYCLQGNTIERPNIQQVQAHPYIFETEKAFPTSSLSHLVRAFKLWESQGGDRRSLFSAGGAHVLADQNVITAASAEDWNFSTTAAFEQQTFDNGDAQELYEVYGPDIEYNQQPDESALQGKRKYRRRPPPKLPTVKAPLEKLFDPNTLSNYGDNSRLYYGRFQPAPINDLPLRDETATAADVRESLIDLDESLDGSELSRFTDLGTIRPRGPSLVVNREDEEALVHSEISAGSTGINPRRRTQEWKFPFMAASTSATIEALSPPFDGDASAATMSPQESFRRSIEPFLPLTNFGGMARESRSHSDSDIRASIVSLIDLDLGLADASLESDTRPSTSHSLAHSIADSDIPARSPFDLEKHASVYDVPVSPEDQSAHDTTYFQNTPSLASSPESIQHRDQLPQDEHEKQPPQIQAGRLYSLREFADTDRETLLPVHNSHLDSDLASNPGRREDAAPPGNSMEMGSGLSLPQLPGAPAPYILQGQATQEDIKNELRRMAMSFGEHLRCVDGFLTGLAKD
ncbi:hypothetical protein MY4038_008591 [Beauveria bassiana]